MSAISVILLAIIFCVIQISFLKKGNREWKKYLPAGIGGIGVVVGIVIYYISYVPFLLELQSQSVLSENQYLGLIVCILFMPCLVGALLGIVMKKFLGKKQFLYFLPFIIIIIAYMGAVIMGLGMISVKEVMWIALFLISGFLLSKEKVWGCLFGMIPGIVFVWMSTKDTGQVINIELPLGMIIIGFYIGCGIGIYRKSCLKK
ncbi:MAG: hypothetical protein IKW28_03115 [Lachnospiraceae bacterium]|nr:hypothetical protein [Lachnospiraceae bacterium]